MAIERDIGPKFHELGTLMSLTKWIRNHDEGLAEWLKNVRRAYQSDRANVSENHRVAVVLLKDSERDAPARICLLDVGGATIEDVTRWSTWQDPDASGRGSGISEEETQGNGGKAYMYRLFRGQARILGVKDKKLNCKGFEGPMNSVERGTDGFIPDVASGRELPITSLEYELKCLLEPYDVTLGELPKEVQLAVRAREAFTLVEGVDPVGLYKGRIDAKDLVHKTIRHDQSTLAIQQVRFFTIHNGRLINDGKPLELDPVEPYPDFEHPIVYDIPEELLDEKGDIQSTSLGGTRPRGRLILYTSHENMHAAYKELRSRWKVTYRTQYQMIGSKFVSELIPQTPGSYFVYATVELSALEPDYVEPGRRRPLPGPLIEAVDLFVAEKMRALAKEINERRRHEIDRQALDEVHEENRLLDNFKNRFLPINGLGGEGGAGEEGTDRRKRTRSDTRREYGEIPEIIEFDWDITDILHVGRGVNLRLDTLLRPRVLDSSGRLVPSVEIEWCSADRHIVNLGNRDYLAAVGKGSTEIWARIKGIPIQSPRIRTEVWIVDHVLLTPRTLEIPIGLRKQIIAEATNDEGYRATDVFLNWEHDADDPLIVRISPTGWVMGNRIGRTSISAGAGDPAQGGVWARIRAEVNVVANPDQLERGGGFPQLKLTGRDVDPETGEIREGDPDQPALWQEVSDYKNNIWWLNLESPEAAFFFKQRTEGITVWRAFHAQKVVEMVIQVHMKEEYDAKGDAERPDLWNRHKAVLESYQVLLTQAMWNKLKQYVLTGGME